MGACSSCSGPLIHGNCPCCGGDCWFECWICGFDFPASEAVLHYKFNQWVDKACADCPGHSDYYELLELPEEESVDCLPPGAKKVQDQGSVVEPPPPPEDESDPCVAEWDIGNGMGVFFCQVGIISSMGLPINTNLNGDFGSSTADGLGFTFATRHHASFRVKKIQIRCYNASAPAGYSGKIELVRNGVPTGITTPAVMGLGDVVSVDCDELFNADDTMYFHMLLYDELGVLITGSSGAFFGITGTWIYTSSTKFLFGGVSQVRTVNAPDDTWVPFPAVMSPASTGGMNLGSATTIQVHDWRYQFHSGPNTIEARLVDRDDTTLYLTTDDAPFDTGVLVLNTTMQPIPSLHASSQLGLKTFDPSFNLTSKRTISGTYTLPDHPYSVLAQAYVSRGVDGSFFVGPGQTLISGAPSGEFAKVALPINGRIHRPIAYSPRNVAYLGSWRIELQLDEQVVWEGFINPGDFFTELSLLSFCVLEGQRVRWHGVRLSGPDECIFGLSFLFGPEGT